MSATRRGLFGILAGAVAALKAPPARPEPRFHFRLQPDGSWTDEEMDRFVAWERAAMVLRMGMIGSGVLLWYGPHTVPSGAETVSNAKWAVLTNGQVAGAS